jgi:rare lipoprotein A
MPARDLGPQDAYSGSSVPPPANYPPQGGYPPTGYPPASYPPASQMPSPASAYPSAPLSSEQRYDNVGYAGLASETGTVSGAHRVLPPGSFVEVTALDNGKTIVVPITGRAQSSREIELSGAAAQLLGITSGSAPVRVRRIVPTPADQNRLSAGQPAESRFDTPPVLLRALRNRLTQTAGAAPPVDRPPVRSPGSRAVVAKPPVARAPVVRAPARQGPGYYVQLAALSNNARAAALAREAGGSVRQKGALWLVRTGPFKDLRSAQGARDGLSRRGYGEARIVQE